MTVFQQLQSVDP